MLAVSFTCNHQITNVSYITLDYNDMQIANVWYILHTKNAKNIHLDGVIHIKPPTVRVSNILE